MARYKVGDVVTIIHPSVPSGSVDVVVKVGRRYLTVRQIDRTEGWTFREDMESTNVIILPGDRQDAIDHVAQLYYEYRDADEQRAKDKRRALWEFERQWTASHPWPVDKVAAYVDELRAEAAAE